jgi:MFS family permease
MNPPISLIFSHHFHLPIVPVFFSTSLAYLADITPDPRERTKAFGWFGIAFGVSLLTGPALIGFLAEKVRR